MSDDKKKLKWKANKGWDMEIIELPEGYSEEDIELRRE